MKKLGSAAVAIASFALAIIIAGIALAGVGLFMTFAESFSGNHGGTIFWGHVTQFGLAPLEFILHLHY